MTTSPTTMSWFLTSYRSEDSGSGGDGGSGGCYYCRCYLLQLYFEAFVVITSVATVNIITNT